MKVKCYKRTQSQQKYFERRVKFVCLVITIMAVGGIALNGVRPVHKTPEVQAQVQAQDEPVPSPLTREQGFISREMPREDVTVEDKIKTAFPDDWKIAIAVAKAESNLNSKAFNSESKYGCSGIFQINLLPERQITRTQMESVDENIAYAKLLHEKSGWKPWTAFNTGAYLKYLK